jgi:hypothetical protein
MGADTFVCDLAIRLYRSSRIHERVAGDRVLLFAPDRNGMPVLVNAWVRDLLNSFSGGITVGEFLSRGGAGNRVFTR